MIFAVEFTGVGVSGDVPSMEIIANHQHLYGTSAGVFVISDGQEFVARNGIDSVTGQVGNTLTGSFHLRLRGHVSDPIPFDASSDRMKAMLESMPNVGTVETLARDHFTDQNHITNSLVRLNIVLKAPKQMLLNIG